MAHSILKIPVH